MQKKIGVSLRCVFSLLLIGVLTGVGEASARDRIVGAVDSSTLAAVAGTRHPMVRPQFDRGRLSPTRPITRASLGFRLSAEQQSELDRLLSEQQDPSSVNYHQWLTPQEYADRFGLSANDLAKVSSWLSSQGLRVDGVDASRTEVLFSGTVGQIEAAFHTEMHRLSVNGKAHFANASDIQVPAAFAGMVIGVRKLNDFAPRPRLRRVAPRFTSSISGNHFIAPGDFATLYDLGKLYSQGFDGTGQTIAVIGQTDINISDPHSFRAASGLSVNDPTKMLVPNTGTATMCSGDLDEANLDVEWSGAVANGASILYVFAGPGASPATCSNRTSDAFDALQYAIDNKLAPVISISYGNCEAAIGASSAQTFRQQIQQANSQGQSVTAAAGDDGAADCDANDTSATQGLAVDLPASIPEVTGIGGTEFTGDPQAAVTNGCASATTYWGSSCSPTSGASALSYIPETTWNDPPSNGSFSATGGGASSFFAKPSWQSGPGVPADGKRDVPDVALSGSPNHDAYLLCSQGSCVNGFRDANNNLDTAGGTSFGAPAFAGILAIINQATGSSGQGNANPNLYSLGVSTPSAFHDITTGNNNVPCTAGTPNCPNGGTIGFSATANYDQVTGLGTIDGFNLVTSWPGFSSTPGFNISANPLAFTVAVGGSGTSTVTIGGTGAFTGTANLVVNLSCALPPNTTNISCAMSPSSVTLNSNTMSVTSTLTINGIALSKAITPAGQIFAAGLMLPGLCLVGLPLMKDGRRKWAAILLVALLALLVACGGGSNSSNQSHHQVQTYAVNVVGTSGSTSHTVTVNVTE